MSPALVAKGKDNGTSNSSSSRSWFWPLVILTRVLALLVYLSEAIGAGFDPSYCHRPFVRVVQDLEGELVMLTLAALKQ